MTWKLLRPSCGPYPQASINERITENFRLLHEKDEDVEDLNVIYKLILPHQEESKDELKKIEQAIVLI